MTSLSLSTPPSLANSDVKKEDYILLTGGRSYDGVTTFSTLFHSEQSLDMTCLHVGRDNAIMFTDDDESYLYVMGGISNTQSLLDENERLSINGSHTFFSAFPFFLHLVLHTFLYGMTRIRLKRLFGKCFRCGTVQNATDHTGTRIAALIKKINIRQMATFFYSESFAAINLVHHTTGTQD